MAGRIDSLFMTREASILKIQTAISFIIVEFLVIINI